MGRRRRRRLVTACTTLAALVTATGCTTRPERAADSTRPTTTALPTAPGATDHTTTTTPAPTPVVLRLDRRTTDPATADFDVVVHATLTDGRGWQAAGFAFTFAADAPYTVVLAEGDVVDSLCHPYATGGRFSCQHGPVVALNADRWRTATPQWTGDLATYRQMLVNHEVGHLLGQHHPEVMCPGTGQPAPVMAQQSTELHGCLPNPWPLPWEIACAARRLEPLAPGYEPDATPQCGPRS